MALSARGRAAQAVSHRQKKGHLRVHRAHCLASAVNLNGPGRYLHWSIFTVSEANLVLIVVMVVIFGAALVFPFPGHGAATPGAPVGGCHSEDADTATGDRPHRSSHL